MVIKDNMYENKESEEERKNIGDMMWYELIDKGFIEKTKQKFLKKKEPNMILGEFSNVKGDQEVAMSNIGGSMPQI